MNKRATVTVHGNAGPGVAENMMSGRVHKSSGFASGGSRRIGAWRPADHSTATLRCAVASRSKVAISWSAASVGSFSAFMAQAGRMVICGDAGDGLGDSLYEAVIYVRGRCARSAPTRASSP
jgi:glutamate synthase domain-containing protein 3